MKQVKRLSVLALGALLFFAACSKNDTSAPAKTYKPLNDGLYVLNEGGFQKNNASLTYYDPASKSATTDIYANINDSLLGDTGNDILIYGSKLYIVMNVSSNITVIDKRTCKSLKQIKAADGRAWQPRNIVSYNGQLFVSAYDGTVSVIDTTLLQITKTIKVGTDPEGLVVSGTNLYVANSGGLNYPNYDSTVSVIDLTTLTETKKIKTAINGKGLAVDPATGNIYEATLGNYANIQGKIYVLNDNKLTDSLDVQTSGRITIFNNKAYVFNMDYTTNTGSISTIDLQTKAITNFITDGTMIQFPYGISIDEASGDVYITDALDGSSTGKVFCFDNTGKQKFWFGTGLFPDKVVFLR